MTIFLVLMGGVGIGWLLSNLTRRADAAASAQEVTTLLADADIGSERAGSAGYLNLDQARAIAKRVLGDDAEDVSVLRGMRIVQETQLLLRPLHSPSP